MDVKDVGIAGWTFNKTRKARSIKGNTSKKIMRIEFYSCMQKPNESVVDFIIRKMADYKKLIKTSNEKQLLSVIQRLLLPTNSTWAYELHIVNAKDLLFEALQRERQPNMDEIHFKPNCHYCSEGHFYDSCPVLHNVEVMKIGEISENRIHKDLIYISLKMNDITHLAVVGIKTTHTFVKDGLILCCPDSVLEYTVLDSEGCDMFARGPHTAVFDVDNFQIVNTVYEVANLEVDIILGSDWLANVGAIIDYEQNCIYFNEWNNLQLEFLKKNQ
ncbi:PREDICTED: uncharacterized protein LOC108568268 [Nicrophorus vespilloides]|uniref:Uncharacterized protein LOC108568268 n=1 Tax=Nicrophorus vespilloides TaxID=110193 RepID=A0ABM1ND34_NICVS|nr:PREDICTED: uncharacterized protein LOC108568268 [Nicrophorus vespilloides]XP_017784734.1 PREDICTED: uncharacterized protein LOC108568268 [Nicrophorus vespilloides]